LGESKKENKVLPFRKDWSLEEKIDIAKKFKS